MGAGQSTSQMPQKKTLSSTIDYLAANYILTSNFQDLKNLSVQNFLDGITEFLVGMTDKLDKRYDTDLLNMRDEMLGDINQLKYRLTLKY